ncbi:MAG TPA: IPT/TIG domain-containing protein [Mucilaginibacter sp.]|nr:IPT/TIG domain-containing protein [Mucilaginibacter sp.]
MKQVIFKSKKLAFILSALIVFGLASCKKDHANLVGGTGTPTITSVSTLSKTLTVPDTTIVTTYDNAGNITTTKNAGPIPVVAFDSTTVTGNKGNYYVVHGSNLGSVTSVMFNGVSAYFNSALVSDNAIFVSIPAEIPTVDQVNKLTVVTLHGKVDFNFTVLTPPPTISAISDYNFTAGSQITLTGVSFASVTSVGLVGSTATATIMPGQTDSQIVLQMPAADVNRTQLIFTYASGTVTAPIEFVDLDNAYQIFVKNDFKNSWVDASWSGPSGVSTGASHSGTSSLVATYPAGGWKIEGWAAWNNPVSFPYDASYKYLTFWVKGGTVDHTLVLVGDKMNGGYGQNTSGAAIQQIKVPAKVWTYYKIPLGAPSSSDPKLLNFWATGSPSQQLGFFLQGQNGDVDETMYFDEVAFVK